MQYNIISSIHKPVLVKFEGENPDVLTAAFARIEVAGDLVVFIALQVAVHHLSIPAAIIEKGRRRIRVAADRYPKAFNRHQENFAHRHLTRDAAGRKVFFEFQGGVNLHLLLGHLFVFALVQNPVNENDFAAVIPFGRVILRWLGFRQHHPRRRLAGFFNEFWKQLEALQEGETFLGVG